MAMTGFICHDDYLSKTAKLTDEELGRLFRALMVYHSTGEETNLELRESIAFDFIREDIDRTEKKYKDKCDKNRETRLAAIENERQRSSTNDNERDQYKEKEKENIKNNKKENTLTGIKEKPHKRFTPPTVEEVAAYCKERGNSIDPEYFVAYYTKQDWYLSNGRKMVDWKSAVITWERKERASPKKVVAAQEYTQRDYSNEQEDAFGRMLKMAGGA